MKKYYFIIILFFTSFSLFSLPLPDELAGIWEGKDRFVFFEQPLPDEDPHIVIVLKSYYGWYFDRAAESQEHSQEEKRIRNIATSRNAEDITFNFSEISKSNVKNAWEINLNYSKYENNHLPICVIDGKMYLDFLIKDTIPKNDNSLAYTASGVVDEDSYDGFWRGNMLSEGIKVASQVDKDNIPAFYIIGNKLYDIRYWKSGMDYTEEKVSVSYGDDTFFVDKHLISAQNVYSSTSGRRTYVRNVQPPFEFNPDNYIFNNEKNILVRDSQAYLIKLADKNDFAALMQLVKEENAKKKPPRPPLFPPKDLDFHWDIINMLEKDNALIQKVRANQKIKY
ncbi:MAG: hypothetical protein K5829_11745 [Treponema sp.]|nr:hypothetical protein [Treponema sp.]